MTLLDLLDSHHSNLRLACELHSCDLLPTLAVTHRSKYNFFLSSTLYTIVFFSVEITRPLTGSEDPTTLYDLISNSTLKDAYQDGKWNTLTYFFKWIMSLVYSNLCFFVCVLDSDETQTQGIFSWVCNTSSPENHGGRPPRPCVEVGANHIWIYIQVCLYCIPLFEYCYCQNVKQCITAHLLMDDTALLVAVLPTLIKKVCEWFSLCQAWRGDGTHKKFGGKQSQ